MTQDDARHGLFDTFQPGFEKVVQLYSFVCGSALLICGALVADVEVDGMQQLASSPSMSRCLYTRLRPHRSQATAVTLHRFQHDVGVALVKFTVVPNVLKHIEAPTKP